MCSAILGNRRNYNKLQVAAAAPLSQRGSVIVASIELDFVFIAAEFLKRS